MPPVTNLAQRLRSRARLVYSLAALVGVVAFGTAGFKLVEGWSLLDSLYMTVMTVTTVGYGPPVALTPAGRDFAIVFMVVGVGTAGYLLSTAVQALVRSEILATYGERRPRGDLDLLEAEVKVLRRYRVHEVCDRGLQKSLRHSVAADDCGRDDAVRARANEFRLGQLFDGARDDVESRV